MANKFLFSNQKNLEIVPEMLGTMCFELERTIKETGKSVTQYLYYKKSETKKNEWNLMLYDDSKSEHVVLDYGLEEKEKEAFMALTLNFAVDLGYEFVESHANTGLGKELAKRGQNDFIKLKSEVQNNLSRIKAIFEHELRVWMHNTPKALEIALKNLEQAKIGSEKNGVKGAGSFEFKLPDGSRIKLKATSRLFSGSGITIKRFVGEDLTHEVPDIHFPRKEGNKWSPERISEGIKEFLNKIPVQKETVSLVSRIRNLFSKPPENALAIPGKPVFRRRGIEIPSPVMGRQRLLNATAEIVKIGFPEFSGIVADVLNAPTSDKFSDILYRRVVDPALRIAKEFEGTSEIDEKIKTRINELNAFCSEIIGEENQRLANERVENADIIAKVALS